jgi:hypothetical protein
LALGPGWIEDATTENRLRSDAMLTSAAHTRARHDAIDK